VYTIKLVVIIGSSTETGSSIRSLAHHTTHVVSSIRVKSIEIAVILEISIIREISLFFRMRILESWNIEREYVKIKGTS